MNKLNNHKRLVAQYLIKILGDIRHSLRLYIVAQLLCVFFINTATAEIQTTIFVNQNSSAATEENGRGDAVSHFYLRNNVFASSFNQGLMPNMTQYTYFENNIITVTNGAPLAFSDPNIPNDAAPPVFVRNNIFYNNLDTNGNFIGVQPNDPEIEPGTIWRYNIYYPDFLNPKCPSLKFPDSCKGFDEGSLFDLEPLFINQDKVLGDDNRPFTNDDGFCYVSGSPGIGKGEDLSGGNDPLVKFDTDILGIKRQVGAWDIGPYAFDCANANSSITVGCNKDGYKGTAKDDWYLFIGNEDKEDIHDDEQSTTQDEIEQDAIVAEKNNPNSSSNPAESLGCNSQNISTRNPLYIVILVVSCLILRKQKIAKRL
ncbi:MAG: hypothetical protein JW841_06810 [Deltaproteobacteria bacterium]|nr:hypothetical protein [Deltaproteobacteria bacterium]